MFAKINANNQIVTYPYTINNLLEENPYTSYGDITDFVMVYGQTELAQQNNTKLVPVKISTPPQYNRASEKPVEINPEFINGSWIQSWRIDILSEEEQKIIYDREVEEIRQKRSQLLQSSDWTQLPDSPVDKVSWANYRQLLRNITQQQGFPFSIVWPTSP